MPRAAGDDFDFSMYADAMALSYIEMHFVCFYTRHISIFAKENLLFALTPATMHASSI